MRFEFYNFGLIEKAILNLEPFTLIAGVNQSGKSFILRSIYSILEPIYFVGSAKSKEGVSSLAKISLESIEDKLRWVFQINKIGGLVNRFTGEKSARIKVSSKNEVIITINESSKKKIEHNVNELVLDIPFEKANFISSPIVLDLEKGMATYRDFYKTNYGVPDIYWDAIRDIRNTGEADKVELEEIREEIKKTIGGYFEYAEKEGFTFVREGEKFPANIVASGIKLFGIIQLLIERNFLRKNTILLLEEPEVHLHPSLRFKLVEILNLLTKNGVYVLLSTHSPEIVAYVEYLLKTNQLPQMNCSFLFLKLKENGLTSYGESTQERRVLNEIMLSLTEGIFDLSLREFEEIDGEE